MNILKVSHGTEFFSKADYQLMLDNHLASVHPDTKAKGVSNKTQFDHFITANKGDLIFICHSNDTVDIIAMFIDERPLHSLIPNHSDWVDREYLPLFFAKQNEDYHKGSEKWWLPGNNSTCSPIKENEIDSFEDWILKPVFDINFDELKKKRDEQLESVALSMDAILELQEKFKLYFNDDKALFKALNSIDRKEKLKLLYEYSEKKNIEKNPVVWLRKKVIETAIHNKQLDSTVLSKLKEEIELSFDKNVFHSWKSHYRVCYPLLYSPHKQSLIETISQTIKQFQTDLGLVNETKIKEVYLDGAQNQGADHIWTAIYNKSYKNQQKAKQLFFKIENGFHFGLLFPVNENVNDIKIINEFNYSEILNYYKQFIPTIMGDNVDKYKEFETLNEILNVKKQVILQGPPGTGKTYTAKDLAEYIILGKVTENKSDQAKFIKDSDQINIIQFHPSYTYEDFIRGIVTEVIGDKINYVSKDKILLELVQKANSDPSKKPYILIIDEINRANLSSVLGELIYALEYRNESFKSMYADKKGDFDIIIPDNFYIIGTMNTADRSVGHLDYALRRRFAYFNVLPKSFTNEEFEKVLFKKVSSLFVKEIKSNVEELEPSEHLSIEFQDRPQDIWLGHSYFFKKENQAFSLRAKYEIAPILLEYVKDGILNNTEEVKEIIKEVLSYVDPKENIEN